MYRVVQTIIARQQQKTSNVSFQWRIAQGDGWLHVAFAYRRLHASRLVVLVVHVAAQHKILSCLCSAIVFT
jgi:hypothetical protein